MRVLVIAGTRPEIIKLAVLVKLLREHNNFELHFCLTGQHNTLAHDTLKAFALTADSIFTIERTSDDMVLLQSKILSNLQTLVTTFNPDLMVVQGDTLSAFVGANVAFLNKIKLAHIEAGLRTNDKFNPYPEEIFRQFIDKVADLHFAPSKTAVDNLVSEGINQDHIFLTGNTGKDAFFEILARASAQDHDQISSFLKMHHKAGKKVILLTIHRRENHVDLLNEVFVQIEQLLHNGLYAVLYVNHPHVVDLKANNLIRDQSAFMQVSPLRFDRFVHVLKLVDFVVTDSGGLQEESSYLGVPAVIIRKKSERLETIEGGLAYYYSGDLAFDLLQLDLSNTNKNNYYGTGNASSKIVELLSLAELK